MPTTLIPIGIAFTLVENTVYAVPAKACLFTTAGPGDIEVSNDGSTWFAITPDANANFQTSATFIRSVNDDSVINAKPYTAMFGGGGSGSAGVFGPPVSVVGNLALWNDTTGTLISDSGTTIAAIQAAAKLGRCLTFTFNGGGSVLATGIAGDIYVPVAITIESAYSSLRFSR